MRRILLIVATLVVTTSCGDDSSNSKTKPAGSSNLPAAPNKPAASERSAVATRPATPAATPPVPETPTLRTAIVGTWVESVFGGGRGGDMSFTKDGRYSGFAISTKYAGTYRVIDDHTIELNIASVLSNMQLVKSTLNVDWHDDLLTVTSDTPRRTYEKQK